MGFIRVKDVKKIGHNLEEIRERALLQVYSKIKLGYIFDHDFKSIKELLFNLFKWFEYDNPKHQGVAIKMLFGVLSSPLGYIIIDIIGAPKLENDLVYLKAKVQSDLSEKVDIIIELVQNKVDKTEVTLRRWSDYIKSDNEASERSNGSNQSDDELSEISDNLLGPGIQIYLMPWVQLCKSDLRKIALNEECVSTSNSVERATFFFNHVLLIDFPADVFLNRPTTIKTFQAMISNSKHSILSMEAISLFCDRINVRIQQMHDPALMHSKIYPFINFEDWKMYGDQKQYINSAASYCDPPTALNQLPLPVFCLDTMYTIVNLFNLNISQSSQEKMDLSMEQMNIAFSLLFKLLDIFQRTINKNIKTDQDQNTQEVIQKMVQLLRSCGDVLNKFKLICYMNETKDPIYRMCYMRMLIFCISFAKWCDYAPFLPLTFISNLYNCLDDISFSLIYPKYHERLQSFLKQHGSSEERNKLKIYKDIKDISDSMNSAIILLQNVDAQIESIDIIDIIKKSLVSLEFHKNARFITIVVDIFCLKLSKWNLSSGQWQDIKNITLTLLAHSCVWIQEAFYARVHSAVVKVLGGLIKTSDELKMYDESSLKFLIDPCVLMEMCSFGVASKSKQVGDYARDIIQHLIRGKLLMSEAMWRTFLEAILPALPILHTYAAHEDEFGKSVIKMLDLKIGECMLIPKIELIKGNIRLLYSKCFTAQMEGSKNLVKFLYLDEENDKMLPKSDCIRSDILCSAVKLVGMKNFNVNKPKDPNFYEQGGFLQVINLLKNNINTAEKDNEFSRVDPSFGRSALAQLAVMLQQTNLHEVFYNENGCDIIKHYLRASLTSSEYTTFPESAMSCISILNSLCYNSTTIRQWASEDQDILLNIIRAILLFPSEENFIGMASQLLSLLSFSHHIVTSENPLSTDEYWTDNLSLHNIIVLKMNLPFKCATHSKISQYQSESKEDWMMKQTTLSEYLRIYWSVVWFGGLDKLLRWPYLPEISENDDFNESLMITTADLSILKASSPIQGCVSALYQIQNATTHKAVNNGINTLIGYILLSRDGESYMLNFDDLPWRNTLQRFLSAPPASPKDLILLLKFLDFVSLYLELFERNADKVAEALWVIESTLEAPFGICALLEKDDANDWVDDCELFSFKLKQKIIEFICECCKFCNEFNQNNIVWNNTIHHLSNCLSNLQINNMNSLAYAGQILECLTHLLNSQTHGLNTEADCKQLEKLVYTLINLCESLYVKDDLSSHKGFSLVFNSLMILSRLLDILPSGIKKVLIELHIDCSYVGKQCL
ncbi:rotatin-like [Arctopsyche grandis]|uniref:rotatin-like n=1 Tax=Arctopsyche grandis TaxID=121162 RepID=UPI00406D9117